MTAPQAEHFRQAAARCTSSASTLAQAALDHLNSGAPNAALPLLKYASIAAQNAHVLITFAEEAEKK